MTVIEYKKYFEKDKALTRRFQTIEVKETTVEDTIKILNGLKSNYENYHNVKYSDKAINKIIEVTEGYPFFIQQLCQIVFQNVDSKVISDIDVENNLEEFFGKLDTGFFKLRYERCSAAEKKFIFAMVKCGELPCTIANIAEIMKKSINSISTARAQLINKGIIYPVKYRELDFTVPQFSGFIHRLEEYKQWDTI